MADNIQSDNIHFELEDINQVPQAPDNGTFKFVGVDSTGNTKHIPISDMESVKSNNNKLKDYAKTTDSTGKVIRDGELAQATGTDAKKAVSQKFFTEQITATNKEVDKKADNVNAEGGKVVYTPDGKIPVVDLSPYAEKTNTSGDKVMYGKGSSVKVEYPSGWELAKEVTPYIIQGKGINGDTGALGNWVNGTVIWMFPIKTNTIYKFFVSHTVTEAVFLYKENKETSTSTNKILAKGVTEFDSKDYKFISFYLKTGNYDHTNSISLIEIDSISQKYIDLEDLVTLQDLVGVEKRLSSLVSEIDFISLFNTDFSTLTDFEVVGSWNNGTPNAVGANNYIRLNKVYNSDNRFMRSKISLATNTVMRIVSSYGGNINGGEGASCFAVDFANKKIIIYSSGAGTDNQANSGGYTNNVLKFASIPDSMIGNRDYIIELHKKEEKHILLLADLLTGKSIKVEHDGWAAGRQNEKYGFYLESGSAFTLKKMSVHSLKNPDVVFAGDSIIEGVGCFPKDNKYASQFRINNPDKKVVISARSGATIDSILEKFSSEYNIYKPKRLCVQIGTNGGNTPEKLNTLKGYCDLIGCELILNHVPCRSNNSHIGINSMIDTLNLKGCFFDIATAVNNDLSKGINTALFSDGVHPISAGHQEMFYRLFLDVPELMYSKNKGSDSTTDTSDVLRYIRPAGSTGEGDETEKAKAYILDNQGINSATGEFSNIWNGSKVVYNYPLIAGYYYTISGLDHSVYLKTTGLPVQILAPTNGIVSIEAKANQTITFYIKTPTSTISNYIVFSGEAGNIDIPYIGTKEKKVIENPSALLSYSGNTTYASIVDLINKGKTYEKSNINRTTGQIISWDFGTIFEITLEPNKEYLFKGANFTRGYGIDVIWILENNTIVKNIPYDGNNTYTFTTGKNKCIARFFLSIIGYNSELDFSVRDTLEIHVREKNIVYSGVDEYNTLEGVNTQNLPFPTGLVRVDLIGSTIGMTKDIAKKLNVKISGGGLPNIYCQALVSWQGTSSLAYAKKNFALDLLDFRGHKFPLKIGNWVEVDSFHFKANWVDFTQAKNMFASRVAEMFYQHLPTNVRRPWSYAEHENSPSVRFNSREMCHIDGFPIVLYLNGSFYGTYNFNLKKNIENFKMSKTNNKHILMELVGNGGNSIFTTTPVNWSGFEIRNPKGFIAGATPENGEVKTAIEDFISWGKRLTTSSAKEEIATRLNVEPCIVYEIVMKVLDNWDGVVKNSIFGTWDAFRWSPMLYDMDLILGAFYPATLNNRPPTVVTGSQTIFTIFNTVYKGEINAFYKSLRDSGKLTPESLIKILTDLTDAFGNDNYELDSKVWSGIPSNSASGYFVSIPMLSDWITKRIAFLDIYYEYVK